MAKVKKSEWQVQREQAQADARSLQMAFDAAAKTLGKDAADSLIYGLHADAEGTVHATAIAEDADRSQARWLRSLDHLRNEMARALRKVDALRVSLTDGRLSAADALRWSDEAFRGAAEAEVAGYVLSFLEERGTEKLQAYVQERLIRAAAEAAPRSSSAPYILIEAYRAVAWSRMSETSCLWLGLGL